MKKIKLIQYAESEMDNYIDRAIKQFSVALDKNGVKDIAAIAENKVIGEFFSERKINDKYYIVKWFFHCVATCCLIFLFHFCQCRKYICL